MVNAVISGIIKAIENGVGVDKYDIYTDNVKQGLYKPCFFIVSLQPERKRKLNNRYENIFPFVINYLSKNDDEPNVECNDMIPILFEALEYIEVDGDLVQTFDIQCEIVDGVLHTFVEYVICTRKVISKELMYEKNLKGVVSSA